MYLLVHLSFKPTLQYLISKEQTGFIAGRYIGENTRLIYDILNYTENENIPGLLLFIDFEKAFDSVSWKFLHSVLDFFNFGDSFKKMDTYSILEYILKSKSMWKFVRQVYSSKRL